MSSITTLAGAVLSSTSKAGIATHTAGIVSIDQNINTATVSHVSSLSRQLAEAAARTEAANASLTLQAQTDRNSMIRSQFTVEVYKAAKSMRDTELPKEADQALMARAQQATFYVNSRMSGTGVMDSPFSGLSAEQLSLIAHDEGGGFTFNERHAALLELHDMEQAATTQAENEAKATVSSQTGSKGHQIMLDRLFGGRETPVSSVTYVTMQSLSQPSQVFLTREDRALVADMYEYALSQGFDLRYVDEIAFSLGDYRQFNNGKLMISFNSGGHYDLEGHQLSVCFDGEMAEVADRLLAGTAINSTRFDQDFLRFRLDPGFGALSSAYDPGFLEHMVNYFSTEGNAQELLDDRFAIRGAQDIKSHYIIHASEEVMLPPFEPDIMKVENQWIITRKGQANGITMADVTGKSSRNRITDANTEDIRYFLDVATEMEKPDSTHPRWLEQILEMQNQTISAQKMTN